METVIFTVSEETFAESTPEQIIDLLITCEYNVVSCLLQAEILEAAVEELEELVAMRKFAL